MATLSIKYLPLFPEASYTYTTVLEDRAFILEFTFNKTSNSWYMSLNDANRNPVVQGIRLLPNFPILSEMALEDLRGYFILLPKSNTGGEEYLTQARFLNQYFNLYYVYNK